jgi:flagellin-like hook-associated protein FlgL
LGAREELFEFTNVVDTSYGAYVVNGAYRGVSGSCSNSTPAPSHDEAVALIRELLNGDVASIRQSAREASTAISTIQYLDDAVETIAATLSTMQELAKKAHSPDYSQAQREQMQEQFTDLAARINRAAESTEYNYNKLFTAEGKAVSISIGDGSKVDIFARDFCFNAQGLDIATDPEGALSKIKKAMVNVGEYKDYLSRQAARAERAAAVMESAIEGAMGVDLSDFTPELAVQRTSNAANRLSTDTDGSLDIQANVKPRRALQLLW